MIKFDNLLVAEGWFKSKGFKTTVNHDAKTLDILVRTKSRDDIWVQVSNEEIEYRAEQALSADW